MKTHLLPALFVAAAFAQAQQTHLDIKVPDTVENDLFGPVKSTHTVYQKDVFESSYTKHKTRELEYTYDEKGNLLTIIDRDIDEDTSKQTDYSYTNGCLFEKTIDSSESETNKTYQYFIDVESRQMLRKNMDTGAFRITAYTPDGYWYYVEDKSPSNTLIRATRLKRLHNNREYESKTFNATNKQTRLTTYKWNSHGLLREYRTQTMGTNGTTFIRSYTHPQKDEKGNWTKRIAKIHKIKDGLKSLHGKEVATREIEYFEK